MQSTMLYFCLAGLVAIAAALVSMLVLQEWWATRERSYFCLSLAFFIECVNHLLIVQPGRPPSSEWFNFLLRFIAYALVLWAFYEWTRRHND